MYTTILVLSAMGSITLILNQISVLRKKIFVALEPGARLFPMLGGYQGIVPQKVWIRILGRILG